MDKHPLQYPTYVTVFNPIVTFFNGMNMSDYRSKRQEYYGNEKEFMGKVRHMRKTQEHLYTLSRITITQMVGLVISKN